MPYLATYLTYNEHLKDVQQFRNAKRQEELARKAVFADKKLTAEELSVAKKRGELLRRTIDSLDEYSQTRMEDVESVTQTVLGEVTTLLTAMGVGLGKIFQTSPAGEKLTKTIASKMGQLKDAAPHVIPGVSGLLFAIVSMLPLLYSMTKIEIQTPRIARFDALKGEMSNTNDFAILTDEQEKTVKEMAKTTEVPKAKTTNKGFLSSINIFSQMKSYFGIVTKRAIYAKDKADFDAAQAKKIDASKNYAFSAEDKQKAEETREIVQRLVNKIDLESQDYVERVFKILDVTSMCLFGVGVVGYWAIEKAMSLFKVKDGRFKKLFPAAAALVGIIMLNSKVAEYRNSAIRISRHKQLNEVLEDPTNFLKTPANQPKQSLNEHAQKAELQKPKGLFGFIKEFANDRAEYEKYVKTSMLEDKKYKLAARKIELTPEQKKDARLTQMNFFKTVNVADANKKKYEEAFEIFVTLLSTPMGLVATTLGNALGWSVSHIRKAPKSHMPIYSILGTVVGLIPAICIELYTTIQVRKASRVAYMQAQKELNNPNEFLDYSQVKVEESPFLRMSFKNSSSAFSAFK